ncbi:hypothetical protein BgiBS90_028891 [Biomphalaria glabrata]|nr:hypothetical protein BgiBS90_028891 [Biomphalaria glabrata]
MTDASTPVTTTDSASAEKNSPRDSEIDVILKILDHVTNIRSVFGSRYYNEDNDDHTTIIVDLYSFFKKGPEEGSTLKHDPESMLYSQQRKELCGRFSLIIAPIYLHKLKKEQITFRNSVCDIIGYAKGICGAQKLIVKLPYFGFEDTDINKAFLRQFLYAGRMPGGIMFVNEIYNYVSNQRRFWEKEKEKYHSEFA